MTDFPRTLIKTLAFCTGLTLGIAAFFLSAIALFTMGLPESYGGFVLIPLVLVFLGLGSALGRYFWKRSDWLGAQSLRKISDLSETAVERIIRAWSVLAIGSFLYVWIQSYTSDDDSWQYHDLGDFIVIAVSSLAIPILLFVAAHLGAWIVMSKKSSELS